MTTQLLFAFLIAFSSTDPPHFASGIKVGEATQTTACVWVRTTAKPQADFARLPILTEGLPARERSSVEMPVDIVPGMAGQVCLKYWIADDDSAASQTGWIDVSESTDFTHQFALSNLQPNTRYQIRISARQSPGQPKSSTINGSFRTAPAADQSTPLKFIVTTCQAVRSIDSGADGHVAYQQMLQADPHFFVHTGDIVYYDKVPLAKTVEQARAKWHLMFAYGHQQRFHQTVGSYFMKDDHDTLKNDCWPGQKYGQLTFQQGLDIFREQVCMGQSTYRTVRWGKGLQIWMTENRDYRSSNRDPDGPDKTILGKTQKDWLMNTLAESDATFRFIISPGPIVGPDKKGKADNHSNAAFAHEGQQLRNFIATQKNTFVICGDRHWQYCSQDPSTGVIEMGCGPINDQHSFGGNPGKDDTYHRYFSARGGFLTVSVDHNKATAEWMNSSDVDEDGKPKVLHREVLEAE